MSNIMKRIVSFSFIIFLVSAAEALAQQMECRETSEGRICSITQPIIAGTLVSNDLQQAMGLITVAGGCSGTLLNRFWILTADHCITTNGWVGGPQAPFADLRMTAAWSAQTPNATRAVRYFNVGLDIALLFLGGGSFGPSNIQLLFVGDVENGMTLTKYGRGIFQYASGSGASATAALADGQYRTARFSVSAVSSTSYTLPVNSSGQVGAGGDSGGPDIVTAPNGIGVGIAGVQSTCVATGYVPSMPTNWTWATGISSCSSALVEPVRFDINKRIREAPACFGVSANYWVSKCGDVEPILNYLLNAFSP